MAQAGITTQGRCQRSSVSLCDPTLRTKDAPDSSSLVPRAEETKTPPPVTLQLTENLWKTTSMTRQPGATLAGVLELRY